MSGKRNRQKVQENKTDKKESMGRVIKDKFKREQAPPILAKTPPQKEFLSAVHDNNIDVVVFNAPAGCGKSFCAMSTVSDWLKQGRFNKISITRPAIGMGNTLGMLKGGLRDKFEPFLMPLIEVMTQRYGQSYYENCISNKTLEFQTLEHIRGRSLGHVVVADEFQNATPNEMYALLTRMEEGGKLIILGDPNQNDMKKENGITWLCNFVEKNPELKAKIKVVTATSDNIVRGGLCKMMVKAMEKEIKVA